MNKHDYFEALGRFLRERRLESGYTQSEVSDALGYTNGQFLSNIERGLCSPPMPALAILMRLYGIGEQEMTRLLVELQRRMIGDELKKALAQESKPRRAGRK